MGAAQQQPKPIDARRCAALLAGFDTGNPNDAEAMGKGRALRRMAAENNMRVVDLLELPGVREAVDVQMKPLRYAVTDGAALQAVKAEAEELRGKLAVVVPKLREAAEALTREKELTAQLRGRSQRAQRKRKHGGGASAARNAPVSGMGHGGWGIKSGRLCRLCLALLPVAGKVTPWTQKLISRVTRAARKPKA